MLFSSRAGGMLVALLFLPLYSQLLDTSEFGMATLVLTGQTLALTLDLGMAALSARESAANRTEEATLIHMHSAEILIVIYYFILSLLLIFFCFYFSISIPLALTIALMYLALTQQNLYQSIMLGRSQHILVASTQVGGVLLRALICAAALYLVESSLLVFVFSQFVGSIVHMLITRIVCARELCAARTTGPTYNISVIRPDLLCQLAKKGLPLFSVGIAGAAALNFDKPVIGWFINPESLAPYFLATTFSLTPVGLLAAPVVQFFQPTIVRAYTSRDYSALMHSTIKLNFSLMLVVIVPTTMIWIYRETIIRMWLQTEVYVSQVSVLSNLLLPAAAIGALGYTPVALLTAASDFSFLARLSAMLSVGLISLVAISAWGNNLVSVCISYLFYYAAATILIWLRCTSIENIKLAARRSASHTAAVTGSAAAICLAWSYIRN